MEQQQPMGFETRAIHAGQPFDPLTGDVIPRVSISTTFAQSAPGEPIGFEYARGGNPTRAALEECLASLEGAQHGLAFSSGLAAEDALLRCLTPGDHVIIPDDAYGGTYRLVDVLWRPLGLTYSTVDLTDLAALEGAWTPDTRMVWVETPSNPLLSIVDIEAVAGMAHSRGATLVVDNTFATPYLQTPLSLGADAVVHSTTKYLGGHSDVVGGFVGTSDDALAERLGLIQFAAGGVPGPFDSYLVLRGVKTLAVRMERHCSAASSVAAMLVEHPAVSQVYYPGLERHPGHALACRQMRGFGGMVSFELAGGESAAIEVARSTRLFILAESLGAVESLIAHPRRMTHLSAAGSALEVGPALLRLSVGLESVEDLLSDLETALKAAG